MICCTPVWLRAPSTQFMGTFFLTLAAGLAATFNETGHAPLAVGSCLMVQSCARSRLDRAAHAAAGRS